MIEAVMHKSSNDTLYSFKITGHAESGPYGHDLVCSAVSALSISTVNSLEFLANITPKVQANDNEGGYLSVLIDKDLEDEQYLVAQTLMQHLYLSLKGIEEEYKQYIKVINYTE